MPLKAGNSQPKKPPAQEPESEPVAEGTLAKVIEIQFHFPDDLDLSSIAFNPGDGILVLENITTNGTNVRHSASVRGSTFNEITSATWDGQTVRLTVLDSKRLAKFKEMTLKIRADLGDSDHKYVDIPINILPIAPLTDVVSPETPDGVSSLLRISDLVLGPASITIKWHTRANRSYAIEYSVDLRQDIWIELAEDLESVGEELAFVDDDPARLAKPNGFYRVRENKP